MTYLRITPSVPAAYPDGPASAVELDALAPLLDVLVRLRAAGLAGDLVWHMPHDLLRDAVVFAGLPVVRCSGRPGLSHVVAPPGDRPAVVTWQRPSWRDHAAERVEPYAPVDIDHPDYRVSRGGIGYSRSISARPGIGE